MHYEASERRLYWDVKKLDSHECYSTICCCESKYYAQRIADALNGPTSETPMTAAAPDLYAALKIAVYHVRDHDPDKPMMLAALAKAEGRKP